MCVCVFRARVLVLTALHTSKCVLCVCVRVYLQFEGLRLNSDIGKHAPINQPYSRWCLRENFICLVHPFDCRLGHSPGEGGGGYPSSSPFNCECSADGCLHPPTARKKQSLTIGGLYGRIGTLTDLDDKTELLPICTCNICVILQYLCLCGFVTDSRPRPEFFTVERMPCTGSSLPHTVEVALGCTEVSVVDISIIIIPQAAGRKQK